MEYSSRLDCQAAGAPTGDLDKTVELEYTYKFKIFGIIVFHLAVVRDFHVVLNEQLSNTRLVCTAEELPLNLDKIVEFESTIEFKIFSATAVCFIKSAIQNYKCKAMLCVRTRMYGYYYIIPYY